MTSDILVNVTPMETRVALVENGAVQEIFLERNQTRGLVGNIYKGKVVRVLPGMQAAFIDIGLERAAFIHASDIDHDRVDNEPHKPIQTLVREGQALVVQVIKDPMGTKGARLTTALSIPSRYLVFMPGSNHIGVSQRIDGETERDRLRKTVTEMKALEEIEKGGFILRTAAEGIGEFEIRSDMNYLKRVFRVLQERMKDSVATSVIYEDLPLYLRVARDLVRADTEKIRIDSKETFGKVQDFVTKYMPEVIDLFEYYPGERPIFDLYSVEDEMSKALSRKVELKSGGYLIIDQTEAMTTIDVNTGAFVGHRNLEETIFKTNLEAVTTICRQLRLRNLGGIIILDFIDMVDEEHRRQVHRMLEKNLEKDHAKSKVTGVSELGLVEMTRKRTRESLEHVLTEHCSVCHGRGRQKTPQTVCYEVFREILREERAYNNDRYLVLASQQVVDRLLDEESSNVADLEEFIGKPIRFQVEPIYSQEQFDVILQ
ncbi:MULTISPECIES: ribonuclease G [Reinekea]|jgi:ribonuclease G|uniref:Cytoplasmic axial filament protein CafA and ribonuclease G n=1 Tax=Reinekea forsetii TaxID=1336806 RepID=A0A2K8KRT6_9GAMM|nr:MULTISPECIES: ribonuclease G [Reinekea]ATX77423.1 cytoplasmic axial filament protein CafA and ribonuclease G [Reinekea forsetii]MDO7645963.1 ribonuclease G [Reinekea forsetii]